MDPKKIKRRYSDVKDDKGQIAETANVFENLLDTLLIQIFEHLNPRDLRRAASVCKRWHKIAKDSAFWNRVDTTSMDIDHSNITKFLSRLPPYIKRLKICLADAPEKGICLPLLSLIVHDRCPNLEELYIERCVLSSLSVPLGSDFKMFKGGLQTLRKENLLECTRSRDNSTLLLPNTLRVLSFRYLSAKSMPILFRISSVKNLPKLEVLDFSIVFFEVKSRAPEIFDACSHLKELYLTGSYVASGIKPFLPYCHNLRLLNLAQSCFKVDDLKKLHGSCRNLEELYLCEMDFCDRDLSFVDQSTFPSLQIICLGGNKITMQSVRRLFGICSSLKRFHANAVNNSKYGYYTFGGIEYKFQETSKCLRKHLCKFKYHI